jgi:hypothetical protein
LARKGPIGKSGAKMPFPTKVTTTEIIELHEVGLNCKEISKRTGLSWNAVYKRLRKRDIQPHPKCRSFFDACYFDVIDNQFKAYWLGFVLADGCVIRRRYKYQNVTALRIGLSTKDKPHLEAFLRDIGSSNSIASCSDGSSRISLNSQHMVTSLAKWGCVPRKTKKLSKLPKIPQVHVPHFIRGYFDGDGSVSWQDGCCRFSIVGNHKFLLDMRYELDKQGLKLQYPIKTSSLGLFSIGSNGNKKCLKFYEIIYSGAEQFLKRKKERFNALL